MQDVISLVGQFNPTGKKVEQMNDHPKALNLCQFLS